MTQILKIKHNKDGSKEIEIIKSHKLSVNFELNKEGIKRKIKNKLSLYFLYLKISYKSLELYYQEMNLYLYQEWLKYEKAKGK